MKYKELKEQRTKKKSKILIWHGEKKWSMDEKNEKKLTEIMLRLRQYRKERKHEKLRWIAFGKEWIFDKNTYGTNSNNKHIHYIFATQCRIPLIFQNEFHSLKYLRSTTLQVTKIKGLKNQSLKNYTNVEKKVFR